MKGGRKERRKERERTGMAGWMNPSGQRKKWLRWSLVLLENFPSSIIIEKKAQKASLVMKNSSHHYKDVLCFLFKMGGFLPGLA